MRTVFFLLLLVTAFVSCTTAQQKDEITTTELKALLAKKEILLVDIRTPEEYEQGFIETAKFVNFYDETFLDDIKKIIKKDQPVYLYCRSGGRSGQATEMLKAEGYKPVNVVGGFNQWKEENKIEKK